MTLNNLSKGDSAIIYRVNADKELKNRFNSFGLTKGARVYVEYHSLAKKTMEVRINQTRIALRTQEAEHIELEQE
ncbi:MAG: ferrous iron transport protein A [gamma proteobacterium symbiont of Taylorina sp.]|nr:ferrous iron transport protein A [gamma proteobacterium symbiont of Taylorina sp.]